MEEANTLVMSPRVWKRLTMMAKIRGNSHDRRRLRRENARTSRRLAYMGIVAIYAR